MLGQKHKTKADIINICKEKNVRFIRLQFTDIFGSVKNVAISMTQLEKALDNKCMFDGSSIEGFARIEESDMYLYPDLDTFQIYPWNDDNAVIARLICDVYDTSGKPFVGDPRYILRKALAYAANMGLTFNVGPECEFFLFETDKNGEPTTKTIDQGGYFELGPVDKGEIARRDICMHLEEMGFELEAAHHECAPGQHEIDFKYSEALEAADNIVTFKLAVKTIADKHNLHATFMPKPLLKCAGSGMHINMSLFREGQNIFYDENDKNGLSSIAYNFIAGIMDHIKGITAITNPLVNSYKRLVPGYEAPVYIAWSAKNRSPLVRVPASRGNSTRIELRSPDSCANPYLALALCLMAGIDGIERNLVPPKSVDGNIYKLSHDEIFAMGIESIPSSLNSALKEMKKDNLICKTLGEHIFRKYLSYKEQEWSDYRNVVSEWETRHYLKRY
ncbi:MAG: type I glutamate--ammonia ligase [Clostridia bacterium]|nr:type I glutamate--ammonia ligase [Clostridia bacterium]